MQRLIKKIKGKTCCLIAQGKSIYELEEKIKDLINFDVCWVGLGQFDTVEHYIMNPVGASLDLVFDCSTQPASRMKNYETTMRIPRLTEYLSKRESNLWITTHGIYRDTILGLKFKEFWERFEKQTLLVDKMFPRDEISRYMDVPNSLTLAVGALIGGGASNIILFGCDGYNGPLGTGEGLKSYYRPEEVEKERMAALGSIEDPGINRDTGAFQKRFKECYNRYAGHFNNAPNIYNCSPITLYNHIRKIDYAQARTIMEGGKLEVERDQSKWHLIF